MAWVTVDDQVPRHHKMLTAGPAACWLWVCALAHCQSLLTDGFIADAALPMIGVPGAARVKRLAETLVSVGLFERGVDGYIVHDYHQHNATAAEARLHRARISERRAESGRIGGIRSGIERRRTNEATKQNRSNAPKQNEAPSHPIPYKNPPTPLADAKGEAPRLTRALKKRAEEVLRLRFGACRHEPTCENHAECIDATAMELAAKVAS